MDRRVSDLFAWVEAHSDAVNPGAVRSKIVELHRELDDESSRVGLITLYCAVTDLAMRALAAQGRDLQPLVDAREADMNLFCMVEAMGSDDLMDPVKLDQVVSREIAAGRMAQDKFSELAKNSAAVLGAPKKRKPGLLSRIFG